MGTQLRLFDLFDVYLLEISHDKCNINCNACNLWQPTLDMLYHYSDNYVHGDKSMQKYDIHVYKP